MNRSKTTTISLAAIASILTLTACGGGSDEDAGGAKNYNIVLISGVSGPLEGLTKTVLTGLETAANVINAGGGIDGRTVKVKALDSQGDPTKAVNALQGAISSGEQIDLVYAGIASAETQAMLPVLSRNKLLSTSSAGAPSLNDPESFPYHFGISPSSVDQLAPIKDYYVDKGVKKLAIITANDEYGKGVYAGIDTALRGTGIQIAQTAFDPKDVDLTVAWRKVLSSDPDEVFLDCLGTPCAALYKSRQTAGATRLPAVGGSGASGTGGGPADYATAAAYANSSLFGMAAQKFTPEAERSETLAAFIDGYFKAGGIADVLAFPGQLAYDGMVSMAHAAKEAGSTDLDAMVKQLESGESLGAERYMTGDKAYSTESHFPSVSDGQIVPIAAGPIVDGFFKAD